MGKQLPDDPAELTPETVRELLRAEAKKRPDPAWERFKSDTGLMCLAIGADLPELEVRFHPVRMWRLDLGWWRYKVGFEREGGTYSLKKSRHTTGAGYDKDVEKYNEAALLGWLLIRGTSKSIGVRDGRALEALRRGLLLRMGQECREVIGDDRAPNKPRKGGSDLAGRGSH